MDRPNQPPAANDDHGGPRKGRKGERAVSVMATPGVSRIDGHSFGRKGMETRQRLLDVGQEMIAEVPRSS